MKTGVCVYCGTEGKLTKDHIPPKALFPPELHKDLLIVLSCEKCNIGASKDDEYLRTIIGLSAKSVGDGLKRISDSTVRALLRPQAEGFRKSILEGLEEKFVQNKAGIAVPATFGNVDFTRLDRVIERIIKGLFWFESRVRLPSHYKVKSYSVDGLTEMDMASGETLTAQIERTIATGMKPIGGQEFRYSSVYSDSDPFCSFWVIAIYGYHCFIGWTRPVADGKVPE